MFEELKILDEKGWFESHQLLLLRIVNSYEGRELLGIDKYYPKIVKIESNCITGVLDIKEEEVLLQTEFRTHGKWGKVIRHRWEEFQKLSKHFYDSGSLTNIWLEDKWQLAATTSTFYPAPGTGGATFDGDTRRFASGETWAQIISGAGLQKTDTGAEIEVHIARDGSGYSNLKKAIALFDTSTIGSDVVSSVTLSAKPQSLGNTSAKTPNLNISGVTTVSDSAISLADHLTHGNVQFSSGLAYSTLVVGTYADFVLNASGIANIDTGGISRFGLTDDYIITNTDPLFAASKFYFVKYQSADTAGTSADPKLVVEHEAIVSDIRGMEMSSMGKSIDGLNFNQKKDIII